MPTITIPTTKSSFLTTQIHLLNTPLTTPIPSNTSLSIPASTVTPILTKINKKISSHNRAVFSLQSQQHVAEQIDTLYWRDVLGHGLPIITDDNATTTTVKRDVDLTDTKEVERNLGEEWGDVCLGRQRKRRRVVRDGHAVGGNYEMQRDEHEHEHEHEHTEYAVEDQDQDQDQDHTNPHPSASTHDEDEQAQTQHYTTLLTTLLSRTRQRDLLRLKVAQYHKLRALLRPLANAKEDIQRNLVTRDNKELEAEMVRMRVLLVRVGNGLQQQQQQQQQAEGQEMREDARDVGLRFTAEEKLEGLLELG